MARPLRDDFDLESVGSLTIGEAARALGVDKNAIRRRPPDELPYHAVGPRGDRRYQAEDVAAYIESRARGRRDRDGQRWIGGRLERIRAEPEVTRTLAQATRTAANAGDEKLARSLRHARSLMAGGSTSATDDGRARHHRKSRHHSTPAPGSALGNARA
jgi:hypothetical protein